MIKTKLKQQEGHYFLEKNEERCPCPYRNPIMVPGQLQGQVEYIDIPCGSLCPLFLINNDKDSKISVKLLCSTSSLHNELIIDELVIESKLHRL